MEFSPTHILNGEEVQAYEVVPMTTLINGYSTLVNVIPYITKTNPIMVQVMAYCTFHSQAKPYVPIYCYKWSRVIDGELHITDVHLTENQAALLGYPLSSAIIPTKRLYTNP